MRRGHALTTTFVRDAAGFVTAQGAEHLARDIKRESVNNPPRANEPSGNQTPLCP